MLPGPGGSPHIAWVLGGPGAPKHRRWAFLNARGQVGREEWLKVGALFLFPQRLL